MKRDVLAKNNDRYCGSRYSKVGFADMNQLFFLVTELIASKSEGTWWDFKKQWHADNSDLLHDIVCLANSNAGRDGLLIIGVDEENDFCLKDVTEDPNRKNTQNIIDFLREKCFAGGIRPNAKVVPVVIEGITLDVVVIKSTREVPYYLTQRYQRVREGNIYVRVEDTNTPVDKTADQYQVSRLWRHHFSLDADPLSQVKRYLGEKDWIDSPEQCEGTKEYYKAAPEYTIEHLMDDTRDAPEFYHFSQTDSRPSWYLIFVRYHQTVLDCILGVSLDGGRYFTAVPDRGFIHFDGMSKIDYSYCYFIKGSMNYLLHVHFYKEDYDDERIAYERFMECVLVFEDELEALGFNRYVCELKTEFERLFEESENGYVPDIPGKKEYERDLRAAPVFKEMLVRYRKDGFPEFPIRTSRDWREYSKV